MGDDSAGPMASGRVPKTGRGAIPLPNSENLQELLRKLWRRRNVIGGTIALLTLLAGLIVYQVTPRYTAHAHIMIEPRENKIVSIETVMAALPQGLETLNGQIEVIRSRSLARRVIQKSRLDLEPEFNLDLRKPGFLATLFSVRTYLPDSWADYISPIEPITEEEMKALERRIIDAFLDSLDVEAVGRSLVLQVSFTSTDPALAARVANDVADLYIVEQLEAKFEATQVATRWLGDRLSTLRESVKASEQAVETFRRENGLTQSNGISLVGQQITEVNSQLIIARAARAEAHARLRQVESLLQSPGGAESAAEVLTSPLIQRLREQEAEVNRKAAELTSRYGPSHPKIVNVQAEARDLRAKIASEVKKITQNLANEVEVATAREDALTQSLRGLESQASELNIKEVQLRALQREAEANRTVQEIFLNRFKETTQQGDIQQADARIISPADTPSVPSFPKRGLLIGLVFVASIGIGGLLAVVLEKLDQGFRSIDQIEKEVGVPGLGLIPTLASVDIENEAPESVVLSKPLSAFSEAIRQIHTSLVISNVDLETRAVMVCSSLPDEGKSSLASALARLAAKAGQKTLLVDGDLRRPAMHKKFGLPSKPGLVEYLLGEADLKAVLLRDDANGAYVITAGRSVPNPTDLLGSEKFGNLIQGLRKQFDLVLIDSPPVLAVSDSRMLARHADTVLFVAQWASTRREVVRMGLTQLASTGVHIAGIVLSMVDVKAHAQYGFSDSGYYYGRYRRYYTT
ncbi:MAG: polysaccharide biosynthesis tyrosine autokinase [Pseudomonadota bacterium]